MGISDLCLTTLCFRYTEIQKHTFNLKTKDDSKDRQVPAMPLAFYNRQGKLTRYNLRKFTELPFQLVRCFRYKDLYDNVLFNYQWLYHKMCALPLPEVLCDFEDAIRNIRPDPCKVEIHPGFAFMNDLKAPKAPVIGIRELTSKAWIYHC